MLTICNVKDFKNNKSNYNYLIVRSQMYPVRGATQFPGLAPSEKLFHETLIAKKENSNWYEEYEKKFREEMNTPEFMEHIYMICELLDAGFTVTLMCYCSEFLECHRRLVGEKFIELGYSVNMH